MTRKLVIKNKNKKKACHMLQDLSVNLSWVSYVYRLNIYAAAAHFELHLPLLQVRYKYGNWRTKLRYSIPREGWVPTLTDCWNRGELGLKWYKWKGSFLGWFVGLVVLVQNIFILFWLLCRPSTNKYFCPHHTLFQFLCSHLSASWAVSCSDF